MTTSRFDIYVKIHKALRRSLFDLAHLAGRTNYENPVQLSVLKQQCDETVHFLNEHAHNEDTYFLPIIEAKVPGSTEHDTVEHKRIDDMVKAMSAELDALIAAPQAAKNTQGDTFYHTVNNFISEYLVHMREEEIDTTAIFYSHCSDEELLSAFRNVMTNTPPADMMMILRYMFPSINETERIELLRGAKATAPAPAFAGMMNLAQQVLSAEEYGSLAQALGS